MELFYGKLGHQGNTLRAEGLRFPAARSLFAPDKRWLMGSGFTLPLLDWISIPAGRVMLEDKAGIYNVEPFAISKYPVTHAQFEAFIEDGGYSEDEWWQGLAQHFTNPQKASWPEENRPRENVSWYEAIAFCRWLSARLGQTITLPTEMQWQRAAQGEDGRTYPWGQAFDKAKCNTSESGIQQTTPVDRYPLGASLDGVMDMSGNVWEWCLNEFGNPRNIDETGKASRVLRGGSWLNPKYLARAASRYSNAPETRFDFLGFRLAGPSIINISDVFLI